MYQEVLELLITDGVVPASASSSGQSLAASPSLQLSLPPIRNSSDLLMQCLHANICKTFVMPIYSEIVSIHKIS